MSLQRIFGVVAAVATFIAVGSSFAADLPNSFPGDVPVAAVESTSEAAADAAQ